MHVPLPFIAALLFLWLKGSKHDIFAKFIYTIQASMGWWFGNQKFFLCSGLICDFFYKAYAEHALQIIKCIHFKVHKNENFLVTILIFVLFHC